VVDETKGSTVLTVEAVGAVEVDGMFDADGVGDVDGVDGVDDVDGVAGVVGAAVSASEPHAVSKISPHVAATAEHVLLISAL
jgi:hypothetical protein